MVAYRKRAKGVERTHRFAGSVFQLLGINFEAMQKGGPQHFKNLILILLVWFPTVFQSYGTVEDGAFGR